MEIRAYVYVTSRDKTLCFNCAVREIIQGGSADYNLTLEEGRTGYDNDMRSIPRCNECGEYFQDFCIG